MGHRNRGVLSAAVIATALFVVPIVSQPALEFTNAGTGKCAIMGNGGMEMQAQTPPCSRPAFYQFTYPASPPGTCFLKNDNCLIARGSSIVGDVCRMNTSNPYSLFSFDPPLPEGVFDSFATRIVNMGDNHVVGLLPAGEANVPCQLTPDRADPSTLWLVTKPF